MLDAAVADLENSLAFGGRDRILSLRHAMNFGKLSIPQSNITLPRVCLSQQ
jgi:hypothetical protein